MPCRIQRMIGIYENFLKVKIFSLTACVFKVMCWTGSLCRTNGSLNHVHNSRNLPQYPAVVIFGKLECARQYLQENVNSFYTDQSLKRASPDLIVAWSKQSLCLFSIKHDVIVCNEDVSYRQNNFWHFWQSSSSDTWNLRKWCLVFVTCCLLHCNVFLSYLTRIVSKLYIQLLILVVHILNFMNSCSSLRTSAGSEEHGKIEARSQRKSTCTGVTTEENRIDELHQRPLATEELGASFKVVSFLALLQLHSSYKMAALANGHSDGSGNMEHKFQRRTTDGQIVNFQVGFCKKNHNLISQNYTGKLMRIEIAAVRIIIPYGERLLLQDWR